MAGFEGIGDFDSPDPWQRHIAHQAAKGNTFRSEPDFQRHHVIPKQKLRQHHVPRELWDDPRNLMVIPYDRHRRHHSRHEPILRADLPAGIEEFAAEVGLSWWLDKHYPIQAAA